MNDFIKIMEDCAEDVVACQSAGENIASFQTIRRKFVHELEMSVRVSATFRNLETGETTTVADVNEIPVSSFDLSVYEKVNEVVHHPVR